MDKVLALNLGELVKIRTFKYLIDPENARRGRQQDGTHASGVLRMAARYSTPEGAYRRATGTALRPSEQSEAPVHVQPTTSYRGSD